MRPNSRDADAGQAEVEAQALLAEAAIAGLRANGAQHIDPLRFALIEALARRASGRRGAIGQRLQRRLGELLQAYGAQVEQAGAEADQLAATLAQRFPQSSAQIQGCRAETGTRGLIGLRQLADALAAQAVPRPLAELLARLQPSGAALPPALSGEGATMAPASPPAELKALSQFRQSWARLDVTQQLQRSKRQAPKNAGPLNSQGLVLRALQQLQAISPDYLDRFVSQIEALMWLEQADTAVAPAAARAGRRDTGKTARQPARPPSRPPARSKTG
jgi:hypothetical protein